MLRSKSPPMVLQELYALFLTHYAVRELMLHAAGTEEVELERLSFVRSLRLVRRHVTEQAAFSPDRLEEPRVEARGEILERPNPTRRLLSNPRAVKRASHNSYPVRKPRHVPRSYHEPATIVVLKRAAQLSTLS